MSQEDSTTNSTNSRADDDDHHEHDIVMPGFRFHPTEEELVEFYLRRKVEGKRFNVELITFLDLYRYDPWELPAMAAIGEKEWFFYVPRDRKYRNGDRPNRVTTSGYWKATGADRMIRSENNRSIGLKKTLVFYTGKAPKGIRTSWIMNEYRLPQHETERYQKAEISLCRVYKRAGVEDHPSLPRCILSRASSSRLSQSHAIPKRQQDATALEKFQPLIANSQQNDMDIGSNVTMALGLSIDNTYQTMIASNNTSLDLPSYEDGVLMQQSKQPSSLVPNCSNIPFSGSSFASSSAVDELQRLLSYQLVSAPLNHQQQFHNVQHQQPSQLITTLPPNSQATALGTLSSSLPAAFQERIWEWNALAEASKDFSTPFK